MGVARTSEGLITGRKRSRLERWLVGQGHEWKRLPRTPLSALDCLLLLLSFLDERDDPWGRLGGLTVAEIEEESVWQGEPGLFWRGLVHSGFIDVDQDGTFAFHDYFSFNGKAIMARLRGRRQDLPRKPASLQPFHGEPSPRNPPPQRVVRRDPPENDAEGDAETPPRDRCNQQHSLSPSPSPSLGSRIENPSGYEQPRRAREAPPDGIPSSNSQSGIGTGATGPPRLRLLRTKRDLVKLVLRVEPNATRPPSDGQGFSRQLWPGEHYLSRITSIDTPRAAHLRKEAGTPDPCPGKLLALADPGRVDALVDRAWKARATVDEWEPYLRTTLAREWQAFVGVLAEAAQRKRTCRAARRT